MSSENMTGSDGITGLSAEENLDQTKSRFYRLRRAIGAIGVCAAVTVGGAIAGMMMFPSNVKVGPHNSEARLTLDGTLDIDGGPLGSIQSPLELDVMGMKVRFPGAAVEIKEIPENSDVNLSTDFTTADAELYAASWEDPNSTIDAAIGEIARTGVNSALLLDALVLLGWAVSYDALGGNGRKRAKDILDGIVPEGKMARAALVGLLAIMTLVPVSELVDQQEVKPNVNSAFTGTFLEDSQIVGKPLELLVNDLGVEVIGILKENKQFYDVTLVNSLREAAAGREDLLKPTETTSTALVVSSLHCAGINMDVPLRATSKIFKPSQIINTGDIAFGGTPIDEICAKAGVKYANGTPETAVIGSHDLEELSQVLKDEGVNVLDGKIVTEKGVTIAGIQDPYVSKLGQGTSPRESETRAEAGARLSEEIAEHDGEVDVALGNERSLLLQTIYSGLAKLAISGGGSNSETKVITGVNGQRVIDYKAANSGGGEPNSINVTKFTTDAKTAIFEFDKVTGTPLRLQEITYHVDGNVSISEPVDLLRLVYSEFFTTDQLSSAQAP